MRAQRVNITEKGELTPEIAELLVDGVRYEYGLGQSYHLHICAIAKHTWKVEDEIGNSSFIRPMDRTHFLRWYTTEYAGVIADHLETSEG